MAAAGEKRGTRLLSIRNGDSEWDGCPLCAFSSHWQMRRGSALRMGPFWICFPDFLIDVSLPSVYLLLLEGDEALASAVRHEITLPMMIISTVEQSFRSSTYPTRHACCFCVRFSLRCPCSAAGPHPEGNGSSVVRPVARSEAGALAARRRSGWRRVIREMALPPVPVSAPVRIASAADRAFIRHGKFAVNGRK